jgi:hypothetical protein
LLSADASCGIDSDPQRGADARADARSVPRDPADRLVVAGPQEALERLGPPGPE